MQRPKIDIYPVSQFVVQDVGLSNPQRRQAAGDHGTDATGFTVSAHGGRAFVSTTSQSIQKESTAQGSADQTFTQAPKDNSALGKLMRLKKRFDREGGNTVRSVEGVLLFHEHGHPHVLLCKHTAVAHTATQSEQAHPSTQHNPAVITYSLPGGKCKRDESEVECLLRKLGRKLMGLPKAPLQATTIRADGAAPPDPTGNLVVQDDDSYLTGVSSATNPASPPRQLSSANPDPSAAPIQQSAGVAKYFRVGEVLSQWYRPNFDRLLFPYVPPHITSVKERKTLFVVHVDPTARFTINHSGIQAPQNPRDPRRRHTSDPSESFEILAVPLFELYQNSQKYGPVIQSIPDAVSRFHVNFC